MPRRGAAGADGEGENLDRLLDRLADLRRHRLDLHADGAGLLDGFGVIDNRQGALDGAALEFETAVGMHEMRAHADMAHDRHTGVGDRFDDLEFLAPTLHFDNLGAALLHQPQGVMDRQVGGGVGPEGHGRQGQGMGRAAPHRANMLDHLIDGQRQGGVMAINGHRQAVANADHVDAGALGPFGHQAIGGGDHHRAHALALTLGQLRNGEFFASLGHGAVNLSAVSGRHRCQFA